MTETDPEKRLIGYACISTHGQMLDTQLSRAHLRRRRCSGIGRLTDPTAAAQLWLRAGSSCPFADMSVGCGAVQPLFDHLVGAHEQRLRDCETKRISGPQIEGQFEPRRLLYWQICRLDAFKDFVDIAGGTPEHVDRIGAIRHQSPDMDDQFIVVTCGDAVLGRQFHEVPARPDEKWVGHYDNSSTVLPGQLVEAGRKLIGVPDRDWSECYSKCPGSSR